MKAVQVASAGTIEVIDTSSPELREGFSLIQPLSATLSGRNARQVFDGDPNSYPLPIGAGANEVVARVVETRYSASQSRWRTHDHGQIVIAYVPEPVGLAELLLVPPYHLLWLPPSESPPLELLAPARQLGAVMEACRLLPPVIDESVVVIGQGSSGLLFDQLLRRMSAGVVVGIDLIPERVDAAGRFGATAAFDGSAEPSVLVDQVRTACAGVAPAAVIDTAGTEDSARLASELVGAEGLLLFYAPPQAHAVSIDLAGLVDRRYRILAAGADQVIRQHPSRGEVDSFWSTYGNAVNLIMRGEIDLATLITHRLPLARAAEAFDLVRSGRDGALKVAVDINQS